MRSYGFPCHKWLFLYIIVVFTCTLCTLWFTPTHKYIYTYVAQYIQSQHVIFKFSKMFNNSIKSYILHYAYNWNENGKHAMSRPSSTLLTHPLFTLNTHMIEKWFLFVGIQFGAKECLMQHEKCSIHETNENETNGNIGKNSIFIWPHLTLFIVKWTDLIVTETNVKYK